MYLGMVTLLGQSLSGANAGHLMKKQKDIASFRELIAELHTHNQKFEPLNRAYGRNFTDSDLQQRTTINLIESSPEAHRRGRSEIGIARTDAPNSCA